MFIRDKEKGQVGGVLSYRVTEFLWSGKTLYVDDLVTGAESRGKGYAGALLEWAIAEGRRLDCDQVDLDSGYGRHDAHRLYLNKRFKMNAHHFAVYLKRDGPQT